MVQYVVITPSFAQPLDVLYGAPPEVDKRIVNSKAEAERLVKEAKNHPYMIRPEVMRTNCYYYEAK